VKEWWEKWPNANIGMVIGSNITVLDFDSEAGRNEFRKKYGLPKTIKSKTDPWYHYFFKSPKGVKLSTRDLAPQVELKGEGSIVTIPPSIHIKSGKPYKWLRGNPLEHGLGHLKPLPKKYSNCARNRNTHHLVTAKPHTPGI
jgi:hypothetical protein